MLSLRATCTILKNHHQYFPIFGSYVYVTAHRFALHKQSAIAIGSLGLRGQSINKLSVLKCHLHVVSSIYNTTRTCQKLRLLCAKTMHVKTLNIYISHWNVGRKGNHALVGIGFKKRDSRPYEFQASSWSSEVSNYLDILNIVVRRKRAFWCWLVVDNLTPMKWKNKTKRLMKPKTICLAS